MKKFKVKITPKILIPEQTVTLAAESEEEAEETAMRMMKNPVDLVAEAEFEGETDDYFCVVARSCGNPDFGQSPRTNVCPPLISPGFSLKECVQAFRDWITSFDLGGGNIGDAVIFKKDDPYCRISYNGRCWDLKDDSKEILA